jgi:pimeloyl-ACP methyl ester carboxylesterase
MQALWDEVENIACPALVIHGGDSRVIRREDAERLGAAIPVAEVVTIEDAGHTVQGDQPVACAAAIADFLGRRLG